MGVRRLTLWWWSLPEMLGFLYQIAWEHVSLHFLFLFCWLNVRFLLMKCPVVVLDEGAPGLLVPLLDTQCAVNTQRKHHDTLQETLDDFCIYKNSGLSLLKPTTKIPIQLICRILWIVYESIHGSSTMAIFQIPIHFHDFPSHVHFLTPAGWNSMNYPIINSHYSPLYTIKYP